MTEYRLRYNPSIFRRTSHEMIMMIAMHGNHNQTVRFTSEADVKRLFAANGYDFRELLDHCRQWPEPVPFFENLLGSTWMVTAGATASRVDNSTGEEDLRVEGPGTITLHGYWAAFESAHGSLRRAVEKASYAELQSAIVDGIASIEAYINYRAEVWNRQHPADLLEDSKHQRVSFDDKVDIWISKMIAGRKLDKSGAWWQDFLVLRSIRDDVRVHAKASGFSISHTELATLANRFRTGVAVLLVKMHLLFDERIPQVIIRAAYAPGVEVVAVDVPSRPPGTDAR